MRCSSGNPLPVAVPQTHMTAHWSGRVGRTILGTSLRPPVHSTQARSWNPFPSTFPWTAGRNHVVPYGCLYCKPADRNSPEVVVAQLSMSSIKVAVHLLGTAALSQLTSCRYVNSSCCHNVQLPPRIRRALLDSDRLDLGIQSFGEPSALSLFL
jgi:hypothetical protein